METELTDIQKWLREYKNPTSVQSFKKALSKLSIVHKKYGTIDINIIKTLIQ